MTYLERLKARSEQQKEIDDWFGDLRMVELREENEVLKKEIKELKGENAVASAIQKSTVDKAKNEIESITDKFKAQLTRANEDCVKYILAFATEEDRTKHDGTVNMELRRSVKTWLSKHNNYSADGFIALYRTLDKSISNDFYRIWNHGQWSKDMSKEYGRGPVSYEWKKLDLCVSNKFWSAITDLTIKILENKQ